MIKVKSTGGRKTGGAIEIPLQDPGTTLWEGEMIYIPEEELKGTQLKGTRGSLQGHSHGPGLVVSGKSPSFFMETTYMFPR